MILAAKCAPDKSLLSQVHKAGLKAVELYLSREPLSSLSSIIRVCKSLPLRYAVHASNDDWMIDELAELTEQIGAEIVVFHSNYWEDEWVNIVERFKALPAVLCIENTYSVNEPAKFMRRYGMSRCLDLEHLQMECAGVYEKVFIDVIKDASHIHLTGYQYGSKLWHTHIHHSRKHGKYMLGLLKKADYSGFIVSEAERSFQTYAEFKELREFYLNWERCYGGQ